MTNVLMRVGQICGCRKKTRAENRRVYVGNKPPPHTDVIVEDKYPNNRIVSSKYTAWNFLPKNLFEQFKRIANFYFLCVGFIELVIDSPVSPITSLLPLIFVVTVTIIKQGYEDWLRHKADKEVNHRPSTVVRDNESVQIQSMKIKVGDIVRVEANEGIPCDMVMLSSDNTDGTCYITTANLDGETNLKTFNSVSDTRHLQKEESFKNFYATIECEDSKTDLYSFVGNIIVHGENSNPVVEALGPENVLLRGSRLKNTKFIYGCAIYTGQDTKISLNSKYTSVKVSQVERFMNRALIFYLIVLIVEAAVLTGVKFWYYSFPVHVARWFVHEDHDITARKAVEEFLSFMVLCNYIIPISMYVTIEFQKFFGSMFLQWDLDMYDAQVNEPAKANTSDLNEELGQVEFLFTDKTGTLTENDMQFRQCSVGGVRYTEVGGMLCVRPDIPDVQPMPIPTLTPELEDLLTVLVLCHTLRVDRRDGLLPGQYSHSGFEYDYQASSPDEKALVEACRRYGVIYHGVQNDKMEVTFKGQMRRYTAHHILDFDPTRKRMSIIVEDETGNKFLMVKGAETAIFDRCEDSDIDTMETHITEYALLGLRTLVIAQRKLTEEEFIECDDILNTARKSLEERDKKLAAAFDKVERHLKLVGATAVEDKLQEGVADTLVSLQAAGIQVWVLTGDKEETAVNISYSAGHFNQEMIELRLTRQTNSENCGIVINQLTHILSSAKRHGDKSYALIIDGPSLAFALADHRKALQDMCQVVVTVLCCRMSPIQKAEVVKLMKASPSKPITAAIGDGANDVSMIQEAHVGLGIMGKEGRQAVRASDYAFGRFKFIKKALLGHGHLFYLRLSTLVQYFFYKNVAFIIANFYFVFLSAYSAQSVYETLFLTFYNITYTSLPILIYGLFEQPITPAELLQDPTLYKNIRRNARLSIGQFIKWNLLGLWHSAVFFFGVYAVFSMEGSLETDGILADGVYEFGFLVFTACVFTVNIKLMFEWYYWSILAFLAFLISFLGYFILTFGYSAIWWEVFLSDFSMYGVAVKLMSNYMVWLLLLLLVVAAIIPDMILRAINDTFTEVYRKRSYRRARHLSSRSRRRALGRGSGGRGAYSPDTGSVQLTNLCMRGESTSSDLSLVNNEGAFSRLDSPVFITDNAYFNKHITHNPLPDGKGDRPPSVGKPVGGTTELTAVEENPKAESSLDMDDSGIVFM